MSNPSPRSRSSWSQCFWCISTCNGRRISRVGPAEPFPVILVNGRNENKTELSGLRPIQVEPSKTGTLPYGVINQFFVPDENGVVAVASDPSSPRESDRFGDEPQIATDPEGSYGPNEYQLANSIFIEIDKDRRIRVVHLQPNANLGDEGDGSASTHDPQVVQLSPSAHRKSVPEEEDEYWFSKWTRKPRFRSIFEKNTIHNGTEDDLGEEGENNNSNGGCGTGALSKDFEVARAAAAAKRRAWAYNNGNTSEPAVLQSTVIDNVEEDEYNSISICESSTKWSKSGNSNKTGINSTSSPTKSPTGSGVTNLGFEEDVADFERKQEEEEEEVIHEMAVDCPPDFVSPTKSLSLKRSGAPSPSPSSSSTIVMGKNSGSGSGSGNQPAILNVATTLVDSPENGVAKNLKKTPILLFIHGVSESSEVWTAQLNFFHKLGFEIVAPDLLGHGISSTPNVAKYYHFESLAQDLLSVYDYFVEEGRKVVIIGHGYG